MIKPSLRVPLPKSLGTALYPGVIDLYDGVDLGNNQLALAGQDFGQDQALLYIINRDDYAVQDGLRFSAISRFNEIGLDTNGFIYTLGQIKSGSQRQPVVHKLSYTNTGGTSVLAPLYYRYLTSASSNDFNEYHFSITPNYDAIFYADARSPITSGFGDYDMLIGTLNLDFTSGCTEDFIQTPVPFTISQLDFAVDDIDPGESPLTFQFSGQSPLYNCENTCFSTSLDCTTLDLTPSQLSNNDGVCCNSFDYQNNSPQPVYSLCISPPVWSTAIFSNVVVNPAFNLNFNPATNVIELTSATFGPLPTGSISNAFEFCASNFTGDYLVIDYFWKDQSGEVVCEDLDEIYCPMPFNCEAVDVSTNPDVDNCCFVANYTNNSPQDVYLLCLKLPTGHTFSNVNIDPAFAFTSLAGGQEIRITRANPGPPLPTGVINDAISYCVDGAAGVFSVSYEWKNFDETVFCDGLETLECVLIPPIECSFTSTTDCYELSLSESVNGGIAPYTYEWDIDCDDPTSPDLTGSTPTWTFNSPGTYQVCLRVTDANGASCSTQQTVTVTDNPPSIDCPPGLNIQTDPGACTATISLPEPDYSDDCTVEPILSCVLSGNTNSQWGDDPVILQKGLSTVTCTVEDQAGQVRVCDYNIKVSDFEPPVITCPDPPAAITVPACDGGAIVTFPMATATDNCDMVTITSTHQSGDFFPCGSTIVTFTATDMSGNTAQCNMLVIVECEYFDFIESFIECTQEEDQYAFTFEITDLTGAATNDCTFSVIGVIQPGITATITNTTNSGNNYFVTGLIDVNTTPIPPVITLNISKSCSCPDGNSTQINFAIPLTTICCKEVTIDPQEVCKTGSTVQIPLQGCGNLYDVQQVRWYVADAPCPPANWGAPIQVTNSCAPLNLSPQFHNGDVCVYAEVDLGPDDAPCTMLTSNVATITLCDPISFT
ncbi:MAG: HYR domain-containing protein, partial [Bacteroidota bacterium]